MSLDGAGDAPGAWRLPDAPDLTAFDGRAQRDAALRAEAAGLVFATLGDALALGPAEPGRLRGGLDAMATACWLAPQTRGLGLLPTVAVTHLEPFHVSTATATLDLVSEGRGGLVVEVSTGAADAAAVGRRAPAPEQAVWAQAEDVALVLARLWDSWEDDAEIRDLATSRFIDRDRLHHVDAAVRGADPQPDGGLGGAFTVRGPSIVPRPPQGQPVVAVRVPAGTPDGSARLRTAALRADLVLVTGADLPGTRSTAARVRALAGELGREVRVLASLRVVLGERAGERAAALAALDDDGAPAHVGSAEELADLLSSTSTAAGGWLDGVELRPAALAVPGVPDDLDGITGGLAPLLHARGLLAPAGATLRDRLGLPRPADRYAQAR